MFASGFQAAKILLGYLRICGLDFDFFVFFLSHQFLPSFLFFLFLSTFLATGTELLLLFVSPATLPAKQWSEFRALPLACLVPTLSPPFGYSTPLLKALYLLTHRSPAPLSSHPLPTHTGYSSGHHLHLPWHPLRAPTDVHLISLVCNLPALRPGNILGFLWRKRGKDLFKEIRHS